MSDAGFGYISLEEREKIHMESMLFAQAGISVYMNVCNNKGVACFSGDSQS